MDISAISIPMSLEKVQSEVSVAVLSNSLDAVKDMGEGITKMMELSVTPYLGGNIDYSV